MIDSQNLYSVLTSSKRWEVGERHMADKQLDDGAGRGRANHKQARSCTHDPRLAASQLRKHLNQQPLKYSNPSKQAWRLGCRNLHLPLVLFSLCTRVT